MMKKLIIALLPTAICSQFYASMAMENDDNEWINAPDGILGLSPFYLNSRQFTAPEQKIIDETQMHINQDLLPTILSAIEQNHVPVDCLGMLSILPQLVQKDAFDQISRWISQDPNYMGLENGFVSSAYKEAKSKAFGKIFEIYSNWQIGDQSTNSPYSLSSNNSDVSSFNLTSSSIMPGPLAVMTNPMAHFSEGDSSESNSAESNSVEDDSSEGESAETDLWGKYNDRKTFDEFISLRIKGSLQQKVMMAYNSHSVSKQQIEDMGYTPFSTQERVWAKIQNPN